jgi:hypothetical protein
MTPTVPSSQQVASKARPGRLATGPSGFQQVALVRAGLWMSEASAARC